MITTQKQYWDNLHNKGNLDHYSKRQTSFAEEVNILIPSSSLILDLGCGAGNDSAFFAKNNHAVIATDFSDIAIEKNKLRYQNLPKLQFIRQDMTEIFPFRDNHFDVVYARLSLHYFSDAEAKQIFSEIYRILRKRGLLCFICKSVDDPLYGKGEEIEKDMFIVDRHTRHFFSKEYVHECLKNSFKVKTIESGHETFYSRRSAFVKVIAQRT